MIGTVNCTAILIHFSNDSDFKMSKHTEKKDLNKFSIGYSPSLRDFLVLVACSLCYTEWREFCACESESEPQNSFFTSVQFWVAA